KSLYVTDVRDTQMQRKIGPFVDTFLTAMVLSELKGKMPDDKTEKSLVAALDKTIGKIEKNQKEDGTFAGNEGWATVLSQGLCNKSLNRARQLGAKVRDETLARADKQVQGNFDGKTGAIVATATAGAGGRGTAAPGVAGKPSDAGVPLYNAAANIANLQ